MMGEDEHLRSSEGRAGSGLELFGGALFLAGCLPAVAVANAILQGTDFGARGLGPPARLAATVAGWLGPWPALVTAIAIAVVGALLVVGHLRTEPLRYVAGAAVSGFGLAAIASALARGAGGMIGDGSGGVMASAVGPWSGVLLGVAVIAISLWLAFSDSGERRDEDGFAPVRDRQDGFGIGQTLVGAANAGATAIRSRFGSQGRRSERHEGRLKPARESRRIQPKKRKSSAPATLGDALARGGTEGVSHDEAAALAPDDKTLAYMESVWRNAAASFKQAVPIPPSPYPEDVRLRGGIPEGAVPLRPMSPAAAAAARRAAEDDDVDDPFSGPTTYVPTPPRKLEPETPEFTDIAPFDFPDALSTPVPLVEAPKPPRVAPKRPLESGDDPFGGSVGEPRPLSAAEIAALEAAAKREGAGASAAPRAFPKGVRPLSPDPSASGAARDSAQRSGASADAMRAGAEPTHASPPPTPSWETGYSDSSELDFDDDFEAVDEDEAPTIRPETIPDVDPATGRWPRRLDGGVDDEMASLDAALESLRDVLPVHGIDRDEELDDEDELAQVSLSSAGAIVSHGLVDDDEDADGDEAAAELAEGDDEEDVEYVDEDGNPIDPAELASGEWEVADEDEDEESDDDEEDAEDEDEESELEDDEEDVEYVDEDGNPIDPAELASGEWEVSDEDEDEESDDDEEADDEDAEDDDEDAEDDDEEDEDAEDDDEEDEHAEGEDAEDEDEDDDELEVEDKDVEYVDEDGNPIDPAELASGEWEVADDEAEDDESEAQDDAVTLPAAAPPVVAETLVDEDGTEYEDADDDEDPASVADVVLEPRPRPARAASAPDLSPDAQRLFQAGLVLVRHGRVAVSLLQKEFEMEFDEACAVLDELQAEGLIGPYKGGKSRDILLSAEEWESRFVGA